MGGHKSAKLVSNVFLNGPLLIENVALYFFQMQEERYHTLTHLLVDRKDTKILISILDIKMQH